MFKRLVKVLIPKRVIFLIQSYRFFWCDIKRFTLHSNTFYKFDNLSKIRGHLTILYHIVEKGLTMPETRLGFGTKIILELTDLCKLYLINGYDTKDQTFVHSIQVLNEYLMFHDLNNFKLDTTIVNEIKSISLTSRVETSSSQYCFSKDEFFKYHQSSFFDFCKSRHSSRNFSKEDIPLEIIYRCVEQANLSPSACNRQPTRVNIIKNKKKILQALELQHGNRGFGHLANILLVITSDISLFQDEERNEPFLNAGLFCMTLVYSLHFHKIGTCLLNWDVNSTDDIKQRSLLKIPDNEQIIVLIACGYLPDEFKIAISPRLNVSEITREIT